MERSRLDPNFVKNAQLKKYLDVAKESFDYIIIDCPPSLELLTLNALMAADSVIIPVQCEFFALEGIMQLLNTIVLAQRDINPKLEIEGVLLTMLDSRTNLGLEVVEEVKSYKEKVYETIIPRLVRLSEAPSHGKPILAYDFQSRGTEAYINLAKEVISKNGN
jgi:chromosome partitioning protein